MHNWHAITNKTTPQWCDYIQVPFEIGEIKRIKCLLKSDSEYYRFGVKLMRENGRLFGDGSIQSMDNNLVIHLGKNFNNEELFIIAYINGVLQGPDLYIGEYQSKAGVLFDCQIDEENLLHFYLNDKEVYQRLINSEIRGRAYLLMWGDSFEYEGNIEDISIEIE
jgi:hypothetical protein